MSTLEERFEQFRPASGALKERLESGIEVPGIVWVDVFDLGDKRA